MRGYSYEDISRYAGHNVDMVKRYTDNCTDVDIDNYELTKINNPENIVKLISETETEAKKVDESPKDISDMGKIYHFINVKLDAMLDLETVIKETYDYIKNNELDMSWVGGNSYKMYQSKLRKKYPENYEQFGIILQGIFAVYAADYKYIGVAGKIIETIEKTIEKKWV